MLALIVIVVFIAIYFVIQKCMPVRWKSKPKERLPDLVKEFGNYDSIDKSSGGQAVWKESTLKSRGHPWSRIEIRDEEISHPSPAPHFDFLYTWLKVGKLEKNIAAKILAVSESISYDPLKGELRARCHFMGANAATLWLALKIIKGEDVTEEDYSDAIMKTVPTSDIYSPGAYSMYVDNISTAVLHGL